MSAHLQISASLAAARPPAVYDDLSHPVRGGQIQLEPAERSPHRVEDLVVALVDHVVYGPVGNEAIKVKNIIPGKLNGFLN